MKCYNCGNYVTKQENFCSRCGNKVNKLFYVRMIVLGLIGAITFYVGFSFSETVTHFLIVLGVYIACVITIEFVFKTCSKKEGVISSLVSPLLQFGFSLFYVVIFGMSTPGDAGGVALIGVLILQLVFVPLLFIINIIVSLIFGKKGS